MENKSPIASKALIGLVESVAIVTRKKERTKKSIKKKSKSTKNMFNTRIVVRDFHIALKRGEKYNYMGNTITLHEVRRDGKFRFKSKNGKISGVFPIKKLQQI